MRIMGLDVGQKRIGIAISDPMGWTAQGHSVLIRGKPQDDIKHLAELCTEYEVEKIVLGFPRNMNGTVGPKGEEIQEFGRVIQEHLNLPLEYWDERLTTVAAEKVLLEANVSRRKRKEVIDKLAAVHILEGYLNRQGNK
jgi:putative holliday junction resolvase